MLELALLVEDRCRLRRRLSNDRRKFANDFIEDYSDFDAAYKWEPAFGSACAEKGTARSPISS